MNGTVGVLVGGGNRQANGVENSDTEAPKWQTAQNKLEANEWTRGSEKDSLAFANDFKCRTLVPFNYR